MIYLRSAVVTLVAVVLTLAVYCSIDGPSRFRARVFSEWTGSSARS